MAQETAKLISSQPLYDESDNRVIWDGQYGTMFAFELEIEIDGQTMYVKAFSKNEDRYSIPNGKNITFETDWDESKGLAYAKKVKDADSDYSRGGSRSGGRSQGRSQGHSRPQRTASRPAARSSAPAPVKQVDYTTFVNGSALEAAVNYISKVIKTKDLDLTLVTVKEIAQYFAEAVNTFDNKKVAVQALKVAVMTVDINPALAPSGTDIKNKDEVVGLIGIYYSSILGE